MTFASATFFAFFFCVVLVYYLLPGKTQNCILLLSSYFFYVCCDTKYLLLLVAITAVSYLGGLLLSYLEKHHAHQRATKKAVLISCLVITFGTLFFFKYWNFSAGSLNTLLQTLGLSVTIPQLEILLPIGISFFTFQTSGYLVDVYRGDIEAERNPIQYALFVSFFLQIMAGPINRAPKILPQLKQRRSFSSGRMEDGILTMLWGFFMKCVISDRIAIFVNAVYADYSSFTGFYILIAAILYSFQIYCDFCGYSLIAVGAARILGIEMIVNFDAPYFAKSVREFWRRWHISLSSWFRDYLYFPLGGSRTTPFKRYRNLMIVFLVSGIWHGAKWTFIIWGFLHGLIQIIEILIEKLQKKWNITPASKGIGHMLLTFTLVSFAWIMFRADNLTTACNMIVHAVKHFDIFSVRDTNVLFSAMDARNWNLLVISLFVLVITDAFQYHGVSVKQWVSRQNLLVKDIIIIIAIILIVIAGIWGNGYDAANFIYTQF